MLRPLRLSFALLVLATSPAHTQTLDPTFAPTTLTGTSSGTQAVRVLLDQPDGKILVAGSADFVDGTLLSRVRRLHADGTLDAAFLAQTGTGPDTGTPQALALQPNGKIIVGGGMTSYNGIYAAGVARLNADGSLDQSFNVGGRGLDPYRTSGNNSLRSLAVQPDGKILVGGSRIGFGPQYYNGHPFYGLLRLNADGSVDTGFTAVIGLSNGYTQVVIESILVQPSGKIIIGGQFGTANGLVANCLVRLNADGTTDPSFGVGTGINGSVRALTQQPDGKILVGGFFNTYNSTAVQNPVRLLANGTLDTGFQGGVAGPAGGITHIRLLPTGSLLLAGYFSSYGGTPAGSLAKVSATGTLDISFAPGAGAATGYTYDLIPLANGQYLTGGTFTAYAGTPRTGLARLGANGSLDASYAPLLTPRGYIINATRLTNGQYLMYCNVQTFNGTLNNGAPYIRLNADGTYDAPFTQPSGSNLSLQRDGQVFAYRYVTATQAVINRLLPSGAVDPAFAAVTFSGGPGTPHPFVYIYSSPANDVFLLGEFASVNGQPRDGIARLFQDGRLDPAFVPTRPWPTFSLNNSAFTTITTLPSGNILLNWADTTRSHLHQYLPTGAPDPSFNVGNAAGAREFFEVLPQPDGRLLVVDLVGNARFTSFNGQPTPLGMLRLLPSGAPDPTFTPALALSRPQLQADGRIVGFENDKRPNSQLRRLQVDGSVDGSFTAVPIPQPIYANAGVFDYFLQPTDHKILLYGDFDHVAGQQRIGLARLSNTLLATQSAVAVAPTLEVFPNPARQQLTLRLPAASTPQPGLLLDVQGRVVRRFTLPAHASELTLPLADVTAGVYMLEVTTVHRTARQRVVVVP